eukprot:10922331-Heterocapsa_arctica.AAC.1
MICGYDEYFLSIATHQRGPGPAPPDRQSQDFVARPHLLQHGYQKSRRWSSSTTPASRYPFAAALE